MRILCDSYILSTKNNRVVVLFMFGILKNRELTMLLILNNWALVFKIMERLISLLHIFHKQVLSLLACFLTVSYNVSGRLLLCHLDLFDL